MSDSTPDWLRHVSVPLTAVQKSAINRLASGLEPVEKLIPLLRKVAQKATRAVRAFQKDGQQQKFVEAAADVAWLNDFLESLTGIGQVEWEGRADLIRFVVQSAALKGAECARKQMAVGNQSEFLRMLDVNVFWQSLDRALNSVIDAMRDVPLGQRVTMVKQAVQEALVAAEKASVIACAEGWAGTWYIVEPTAFWGHLELSLPVAVRSTLYRLPEVDADHPTIELANGSVKVWAIHRPQETDSLWTDCPAQVAAFIAESSAADVIAPTAAQIQAMNDGDETHLGTIAVTCYLVAHNWVGTLPVKLSLPGSYGGAYSTSGT